MTKLLVDLPDDLYKRIALEKVETRESMKDIIISRLRKSYGK